MGPIWIVDDPRFDGHRARHAHPERPERLAAARQGLWSGIPAEARELVGISLASDRLLEGAHRRGYVAGLRSALGGWGQLDGDTYFSPETEEAAWLAAGGAAALATHLASTPRGRGIALLRPPGHHARPGAAMGFCLLNNVAVAAYAALEAGLERIAILDWDVHHGNGTQEIFASDRRVLFVSLHQFPHYPGTGSVHERGEGGGRGATVNIPLPSGVGPEVFGEAFRRIVLPTLDLFDPELVLVSAGFDAHSRDPLAGLELDDASYGAFTTALCDRYPRIGLVLEGGYDLIALEGSLREVGRALCGQRRELPEGKLSEAGQEAIDRALEP
ncbi:MAG: histone deacetylase [Myxococcota bacterium]